MAGHLIRRLCERFEHLVVECVLLSVTPQEPLKSTLDITGSFAIPCLKPLILGMLVRCAGCLTPLFFRFVSCSADSSGLPVHFGSMVILT